MENSLSVIYTDEHLLDSAKCRKIHSDISLLHEHARLHAFLNY
jgi:hypothetical protein